MKNLICLDTETTGFNPEHDRIIEIGCVNITKGIANKTIFQQYINPLRSVPYSSVKVHGLTQEFLSQFKPFDEYIKEFLNFIKDATLIIHNATFDLKFLNAELQRINLPTIKNEIIDTLTLARQMFPGKKVNLEALKKYYEVKIQRTHHGALIDSEILAHVYLAMQKKQSILQIKTAIDTKTTILPSFAKIQINEKEKENHLKVLNAIQN